MKPTLAVIALLTFSAPATAFAEWENLDADEIVEACWTSGQEDIDSGVTARMQRGIAVTAQCLRTRILENAAPLFAATGYTAKQQLADLDRITQSAGSFYAHLYAQNRACAPACGTLPRIQAGAEIPDLLERVLRNVVETRNQYRM
jgi:hypothetical protein